MKDEAELSRPQDKSVYMALISSEYQMVIQMDVTLGAVNLQKS